MHRWQGEVVGKVSEKVQQKMGRSTDGTMKNPQKMTDKELVAKVKELTNTIYLSRDQFIACLIEVKKRKLWDNGRFVSIFHYAKVMACLTQDVTERVFRMYERIKDFPEVLQLFLEVRVGWSKIEIVARVLNKRNVRHFVRRLQTDSTSTLKRLVKNIRKRNKRKKEEKSGSSNGKETNRPVTAKPEGQGASGGSASQTTVLGAAHQSRGNGDEEEMAKPESAEESISNQKGFAFSQGDASAGQGRIFGNDEAAANKEAVPCEACGHVKGDCVQRGHGRRLVPMMVTPAVRDIYERLLSKWQRKDQKVRMNEVAERVMLAALEMGVDLTFDSEKGPIDSKSGAFEKGEGEDTNSNAKEGKSGVALNKKGAKREKSKKVKSASRARAWWKRPYVQIINYDVATGAFLTKTYDGWERVCDRDLAYREALYEPVDLKKLRLEAKEFAAEYIRKHILEGKDITDYIPEFIKYYIEMRSQGFCEFPGCKNRACTIHHLKRFGRDPDCDPDGLGNFCEECEKLFHDGAVNNEFGPFKDFEIREDYIPKTKGEKERAKIDAKVRKWRKKSKESSMPYPLPRKGRRKMRYGKG